MLRNIVPNAQRYDEDNIMEGTLATEEQRTLRVARLHVFRASRSDEVTNRRRQYASSALSFNADASANYGVPAIKKIFSRFIPFGGRAVGSWSVRRSFRATASRHAVGFEIFREHDDIQIGTGI